MGLDRQARADEIGERVDHGLVVVRAAGRQRVIGGGVAGATSAPALRRIGAEVSVYEAYEDPAGDVGAFVSLVANGLRGLDELGALGRATAWLYAYEPARLAQVA